MYSFLIETRVLPEKDYQFFEYNGPKPVTLNFRGNLVEVARGTRFGVRPSTNGKFIRLIFPKEPTKVYTIDLDTAKKLARGIKTKASTAEVCDALGAV